MCCERCNNMRLLDIDVKHETKKGNGDTTRTYKIKCMEKKCGAVRFMTFTINARGRTLIG